MTTSSGISTTAITNDGSTLSVGDEATVSGGAGAGARVQVLDISGGVLGILALQPGALHTAFRFCISFFSTFVIDFVSSDLPSCNESQGSTVAVFAVALQLLLLILSVFKYLLLFELLSLPL